jgi:hypothetical protein
MWLNIPETVICAFVLSVAVLVAAGILSRSIAQHASVMSRIAGDHVFDAAASVQIGAETWRGVIEQIATDVLRRPVRVASFTSLTMEQEACLRFVLHDGRLLEFTTNASSPSWRNAFIRVQSPRLCGELHALCSYFAQQSGSAGAVPRNARWQMRVVEPAITRALLHKQR